MKINLKKVTANKWMKKPAAWAALGVLLVLLGAGGWFFLRSASASSAEESSVQNYTARAQTGDLSISAEGTANLISGSQVALAFSSGGVVGELNVQVGDAVKAGDVLARLKDVQQLEASLASSQVALMEAQEALDTLNENAGAAAAEAFQAWVTAQETYNEALLASTRSQGSRCSKAVNSDNAAVLERARARLADAEPGTDAYLNASADVETAYANWAYCISFSDTEKKAAQAALQVAEAQWKQAGETYERLQAANGVDPDELALAQAQLEEASLAYESAAEALSQAVLVAPIDGTVISIAAGAGETVGTDTFIEVADLSDAVVEVQVDEADLDLLQVGFKVEVVFDAFPRRTLAGVVTQVDPALTSSGQYSVVKGLVKLDEAPVQDNGKPFPLGLNGSSRIISQEAKNAVLVPVEALRQLDEGQYAVFVEENSSLVLRTVQVGILGEESAEILSGLKAGEVVSTGITEVQS